MPEVKNYYKSKNLLNEKVYIPGNVFVSGATNNITAIKNSNFLDLTAWIQSKLKKLN